MLGHDPVAVLGDGLLRVDPFDREVRRPRLERLVQVCGRVGGREQHLVSSGGELEGDSGGDCGLADAALAHAHDQAVPVGLEVVDEVDAAC